MLAISDLPHLLALINALTILTLTLGFVAIRSGNRERHMRMMKITIGLGLAFLGVYAFYKLNSGFAKFGGEGAIRPVYFSILLVHVVAAAISLFMVPITVFRALKRQFEAHRRIARWTWPVWMFVAVTGIVVYVMAVHIYPTPVSHS